MTTRLVSALAARAWLWRHGLGLGKCHYRNLTGPVWRCSCGSTWGTRPAREHTAAAFFALGCLLHALIRHRIKEK